MFFPWLFMDCVLQLTSLGTWAVLLALCFPHTLRVQPGVRRVSMYILLNWSAELLLRIAPFHLLVHNRGDASIAVDVYTGPLEAGAGFPPMCGRLGSGNSLL